MGARHDSATDEAARAGWRVVRVEQPWRVAGKRIATAPPRQNGTAHPTDGIAMDAVKTWTVQVDVDEHEGRTC